MTPKISLSQKGAICRSDNFIPGGDFPAGHFPAGHFLFFAKWGSQAVFLFLADLGVPNFSRAGFPRAEFTLPHLKLGTPFRVPGKIGHAPNSKIESD